jgi:hypothetical protein
MGKVLDAGRQVTRIFKTEIQSLVQRGLCVEAKEIFYFGSSKEGSRESQFFFLLSCQRYYKDYIHG